MQSLGLVRSVALLVSGPVLAGSTQQEQLTQCKAELAAIYGEGAGTRKQGRGEQDCDE